MKTSAEMAGGTAVGFKGRIRGFNADAERRLGDMLMAIGRWAESETGAMIGHIKMSVSTDTGGITLNLTDLSEGVLHHGTLRPTREAEFHIMAALTDVDRSELEHEIMHAMDDSGVFLDFDHRGHSHDHTHDHNHDHEHVHDENCGCGCRVDVQDEESESPEEDEEEPRGRCCRRKYDFR